MTDTTMDQSNDDKVILDVYRKIEREKVIIQGAKSVRQSTTNASVQQRCDTNIREAQNNIAYLEETMRQLKLRKRTESSASSASAITTSAATPATAVTATDEANEQGEGSSGGLYNGTEQRAASPKKGEWIYQTKMPMMNTNTMFRNQLQT